MEKSRKEELEVIKNYIKNEYCCGWHSLHSLGCIIFEEFIRNGIYFLKIKNKCFWINKLDGYQTSLIFCINIEQTKILEEVKNLKIHECKRFKIDWVINILVKNDKVVEYLCGKI